MTSVQTVPMRQLPAKRDNASAAVSSALTLAFIAGLQGYALWFAILALGSGDVFTATFMAIFSLIFFWATGAYYVALPVSMYFSAKYRKSNDFVALDRVHRRAAAIIKRLPLRRTLALETTMSNLGVLRLCQGDYESAENLFHEAVLSLNKNKRYNKSVSMVVLLHNLGVTYLKLNKLVEADLQAAKALELAEMPHIMKQHAMMSGAPLGLHGAVRLKLGETESAMDYLRKALDRFETSPLPRYYTTVSQKQAIAFAQLGLALGAIRLERQEESIEWFDKSWQNSKEYPMIMSTMALESLNLLANEYLNHQLFDKAELLLQVAYFIAYDHPFHPESKQVLNYYEKLFLLTNRQSEVTDMRSWLRPHVNPLSTPMIAENT